MIIWSGWGILSGVFAVIAIVVGVAIGAAVGPLAGGLLGGCFGAFLNHLVAKSAGKGKVMIDPATNQQVLMKKSNSLFFIPMAWFTPLIAIGGLLFGLLAMSGAKQEKEMDAMYPGKAVYEKANDMIDSSSSGATANGNTPAAEKAAEQFATGFKAIQAIAFEGGSKKNVLTKGNFLTYCYQSKDGVTFICHVPSLRSYKDDEAKEALDQIAWEAAKRATGEIPDLSEATTLTVGLRGIASYGSIRQGELGAESGGASQDKELLYKIFDPENEAAP